MDISASSQCEAFSQDMLPDSVRDIDTEDLDNPQLVAEYVGDIYAYMRHLEVRTSGKQEVQSWQDLLQKSSERLV